MDTLRLQAAAYRDELAVLAASLEELERRAVEADSRFSSLADEPQESVSAPIAVDAATGTLPASNDGRSIEFVRAILIDAPGLSELPVNIIDELVADLASGTCAVVALEAATGEINRQTLLHLVRSGEFC